MRNLVRAALTVSVLAAAASQAVAGGNICAPSNAVNQPGIGDGCTTTYQGVDGSYVFLNIGIFKPTFTSSCNRHDKCYTTLGSTYSSCNGQFLSDMKDACKSSFNPLFFPTEYAQCYATANSYYAFVEGYADKEDPLPGLLLDALKRSITMQRDSVEKDTCGTTPEITTLYTSSLISKINGAFQTNAGRLPTIYEFLTAVNAGTDATNYVTNLAWWESNLTTYSRQRASVAVPTVGYTSTQDARYVRFTASPIQSSTTYLWKTNGTATTGTTMAIPLRIPKYNLSWKVEGFIKATHNDTKEKNMKVIDTWVNEQGWCRDVPGGPCF
ncbi:MAG TPA: hypothetical protein VFY73_00970 [Ideonella sp.]|uniref:hypothetical protein n=1 Tax=Ideonella sp. TaxID=1929293 RepID=UPI002E32B4B8|nr:hypothetical protein [Ideonella sp.]HEX5682577.1 hypothetical protein [Ideonella sp.]